MQEFLIHRFVKNYDNIKSPEVRQSYGTMTSIIGIVVNLLLFTIKFVAGTLSGSIAITGDAVNNLSDAGSSVISLISFKISNKPADLEHPFGHARIEYIAASTVAIIILLIGVELIQSSIGKIRHPSPVDFTWLTAGILVFSIAAKLWLTRFNSSLGKRIGSTVMKATAADSLADVMATTVVLFSAVISPLIGFQLDGYMGIAVALFIMNSGLGILKETLDSILGQGPTEELSEQIENYIHRYPGISGIHDLVAHNYGPNRWFASVHVEVDAAVDILISHDLIDTIERDIMSELSIHLVIHMDPVVKDDPLLNEFCSLTQGIVSAVDDSLTLHDFRLVRGSTFKKLVFDVNVPYDCKKGDQQILDEIEFALKKQHINAVITIDRSYLTSSNYKIKKSRTL
ncbi:MAG: cation diffusion facilitator family transporter [Acidaminobacter sp.]|uniref:cation diffusion facilitator family transporter n=1 Tax=Acidaminobacter sp. TaxID=1872102 RepID=UPI0013859BD5|nr:cation diffusion facilitator family transporter [Acidaminobacter sp.]MZQ96304.1 cation diffusion facilitator family transporter [Acidaminobacter sp.]